MLGVVLKSDGRHELAEVQKPAIGSTRFAPRDVLIEVEYCGICGSDVHMWGQERDPRLFSTHKSVVAGHEIVGLVKEVGPEVVHVSPGDRVVCEVANIYCGNCVNCRQGLFNICCNVEPMDGRAHYVVGGGFAKYTVWPEAHVHRLPDSINPRSAVLMEPTAGSTHGLYERARLQPGENVVILGPGARGVILAQLARAAGAKNVIVTGVTRDTQLRLKMAEDLADAITVNVDEEDVRDVVDRVTGGIGADVVVENAGVASAINDAIDVARPGGRVIISGGGIRGGITASFDTRPVIVKELTLLGEISQTWTSWRTALSLVASGRVNLDPLVTKVLPLEEWEKGYELAATSSEVMRVALSPMAGVEA